MNYNFYFTRNTKCGAPEVQEVSTALTDLTLKYQKLGIGNDNTNSYISELEALQTKVSQLSESTKPQRASKEEISIAIDEYITQLRSMDAQQLGMSLGSNADHIYESTVDVNSKEYTDAKKNLYYIICHNYWSTGKPVYISPVIMDTLSISKDMVYAVMRDLQNSGAVGRESNLTKDGTRKFNTYYPQNVQRLNEMGWVNFADRLHIPEENPCSNLEGYIRYFEVFGLYIGPNWSEDFFANINIYWLHNRGAQFDYTEMSILLKGIYKVHNHQDATVMEQLEAYYDEMDKSRREASNANDLYLPDFFKYFDSDEDMQISTMVSRPVESWIDGNQRRSKRQREELKLEYKQYVYVLGHYLYKQDLQAKKGRYISDDEYMQFYKGGIPSYHCPRP